MSQVLVTGGAGYIGSHTLVSLVEAGHDPVVIDNLSNGSYEAVLAVERITGAAIRFHHADIRDEAAVRRVCETARPAAAIHFAGLKSLAESIAAPLDYYDVNVSGTLSLMRALLAVDCRRVVFSSSATVYGAPLRQPIDEDHPLSATNPYGRSKLMVEEILRDAAVADARFSCAILRYFNPVGAHPSALIGEKPAGTPANLAPFVADVAAGSRPRVAVFGCDYDTPDGTGLRDYLHVCDLAEAHVAALDWTARLRGARAFNLGVGRGFSVLDLIDAFQRASGRPIPWFVAPRRAGDVASCVADPSRAAAELAWRATRSVDAMAADAWRWRLSFT